MAEWVAADHKICGSNPPWILWDLLQYIWEMDREPSIYEVLQMEVKKRRQDVFQGLGGESNLGHPEGQLS